MGAATALMLTIVLVLMRRRHSGPAAALAPAAPTGITT